LVRMWALHMYLRVLMRVLVDSQDPSDKDAHEEDREEYDAYEGMTLRPGDKRPTLVAMSVCILHGLPQFFLLPASSSSSSNGPSQLQPDLYGFPADDADDSPNGNALLLCVLFDVLGAWLHRKHSCPNPSSSFSRANNADPTKTGNARAWTVAYETFGMLLQALDYGQLRDGHWRHLVTAVTGALQSMATIDQRLLDSAEDPGAVLCQEELVDERFLAVCLGQCLLPFLHLFRDIEQDVHDTGHNIHNVEQSGQVEELKRQLLEWLERVGHFVQYIPLPASVPRTPFLPVQQRLFPVPKERVAHFALGLMFAALKDQSNVAPETASLCLDILLRRTSRLLQLYVKDTRLPVHNDGDDDGAGRQHLSAAFVAVLRLPPVCTHEVLHLLAQWDALELRADVTAFRNRQLIRQDDQRAPRPHFLAPSRLWHLWCLYEDLLDMVAFLDHRPQERGDEGRVFVRARAMLRRLATVDLGVLGLLPRMTPAQSHGPPELHAMVRLEEIVSPDVYEQCLLHGYHSLLSSTSAEHDANQCSP
jgi:hypothetical protein